MPAAASRSGARRLLSGLLGILSVVGLTALFGVGAAAGLLGHLNLPAGRRATAAFVGKTLRDLFQGELVIGSITKVSPYEVQAEDIIVRDRAGRVVLQVTRITAQADVRDILTRILRGDEKLTIVVNHVRVERAEAEIVPDTDGLPTLAHALTPRPAPSSEPVGREQDVRVWLPAVEIGHAFARGRLGDSPTVEVELSGAHGSLLATPKGAAIDVARFALLARGLGGADAKGVASLHIRAPGAVWSSFDGYMGEVQFGSVIRWEGQALDLKLELPRAEPAAARALLAQWPLLVPAEARVHLKGTPPHLDVDVQARLGDSARLSSTGSLELTSPPRLHLDVEGRQLDLRALWPEAPPTSFDVDADVGLLGDNGKLVVQLGGALQPTTVGRFAIPAVDFSSRTDSSGWTGEAKVHDLGLPVNVGFSIAPDGKLEVDAEAKHINLAQVPRIKPYFDAAGSADMRVHAALDHGRLDTNLTLDVRGLAYRGVALESGRLSAAVKGALDKPEQLTLDAQLTGKQLNAGQLVFQDVTASARGPVRAPTVSVTLDAPDGPSFDARAVVTLARPISVRDLSLGVSRDNVELRGEIAQLDLAKDRVLVRELRLHGATGELSGNAELTPHGVSVSAQGQNLDLSAFSRIIGLPRGQLEGRASLALDAFASASSQRGNVELSLDKAAFVNLNGISGQLSAKLDGRQLSVVGTGHVESLGSFSTDWETTLDGPVTERASFERAVGSATLALTGVTLEYIGQLLPQADIDVGGQADVTLKAARSEPDAVPTLEISGQTHGLSVRVERQGGQPLSLSGVEVLASAAHDGPSGNTTFALGLQQGAERLLSASADMTLDARAALTAREPLVQQLEERPILAKIVVNRVDLDSLPLGLRVPGLRGALRVEGTARGSVSAPIVSLGLQATDLRVAAGDRGEPIDLCGTAEYAKDSSAFNIGAELFLPGSVGSSRPACDGKRIAAVQFRGHAPFDFERGIPSWSGTASAVLEGLPLQTLPPLASARVTGTVAGKIVLDRSGDEPNASASLQLAGVRVDRLEIGDGALGLRSDGDRARVDFEIKHGRAAVKGAVNAGLSWSSQVPAVDEAAPIELSLEATKLEASVLEPFLSDLVSELHGNLDARISARLEPLAKGEPTRRVEQVGGKLELTDGSFVLTGLGFRLRDVSFAADARRDGKTTLVDIPELSASAGTKSQNLRSHVLLRLAGFDIVSGSVSFNVTSLPLVVDGITRANADAAVSMLSIKRETDRLVVDVPFERLVVRLPEESSRELISLDENENVKLLQPIEQPKGDRDDAALPWQFAIHLGSDAVVTRGAQLEIPITGDPIVVLASGIGVTGSVILPPRRGAVQLLGRTFQIEGGAIVFDTPDPKDPRLDVRATWRSSTSDTLFMYISGTISKPKVQFDRPEQEALALLAGTGGSSNLGAASIGFSALDSLLADTPLARVQLRGQDSADTTKGATYTAAYRASDRVIVEGNYQAAGTDSAAQGGTVGAAVDYRMTKTISIRAQLGTIGTGVDLIYQYRY
jgi:translocation and assembly module TamB